MDIVKINSFLDNDAFEECCFYLNRPCWEYGHKSNFEKDKNGFWTMNLSDIPFFNDFFLSKINEYFGAAHFVERIYANGQTSEQSGFYHQDGATSNNKTLLFYCNKNYQFDWGGHTDFLDLDTEKLISIPPIPNSSVYFSGNILHRGNSFNNSNCPLRTTVAFKLVLK